MRRSAAGRIRDPLRTGPQEVVTRWSGNRHLDHRRGKPERLDGGGDSDGASEVTIPGVQGAMEGAKIGGKSGISTTHAGAPMSIVADMPHIFSNF